MSFDMCKLRTLIGTGVSLTAAVAVLALTACEASRTPAGPVTSVVAIRQAMRHLALDPATRTVAWWPLDDSPGALAAVSGLPRGVAMTAPSPPTFGVAPPAAGMASAVDLSNGASLSATLEPVATTAVSVSFVARWKSASDTVAVGVCCDVPLSVYTHGGVLMVGFLGPTTAAGVKLTGPYVGDGAPHHVVVSWFHADGDDVGLLRVDGMEVGRVVLPVRVAQSPASIQLGGIVSDAGPVLGEVLVAASLVTVNLSKQGASS